MLIDIWFWLFLLTGFVLAFSLAHNITNGKTLRTSLEAELAKLRIDLANRFGSASAPIPGGTSDPAAQPNAAGTGVGTTNRGSNA